MDVNGVGGPIDLSSLHSRQEERFGSLETVIKDGFGQVSMELKAMREQGHIPIEVMYKIIDVLRPIIKALCVVIVFLVMWLTGLKALVPGLFDASTVKDLIPSVGATHP